MARNKNKTPPGLMNHNEPPPTQVLKLPRKTLLRSSSSVQVTPTQVVALPRKTWLSSRRDFSNPPEVLLLPLASTWGRREQVKPFTINQLSSSAVRGASKWRCQEADKKLRNQEFIRIISIYCAII